VPEIVHVDCSFCPPGFPLPARAASLEHFRATAKSRRDAAAQKPLKVVKAPGAGSAECKSGAAD
jgi:hypothetical protein